MTKCEILYKDRIQLYFPQLINYVDMILVTENNYICIKDFWTFNNFSVKILNDYLFGSDQINNGSNKKFIFIIFTKYLGIYNNLQNNEILNSKNIYILHKNILDNLYKDFSYLLYSNNIFFYDNDMDTIMLE